MKKLMALLAGIALAFGMSTVAVPAAQAGPGGHIWHRTPDDNANVAWSVYCRTPYGTTLVYSLAEGQWSYSKPNCSYVYAVWVPTYYSVWCRVYGSGTVFSPKFNQGYNEWPGSNYLDCKTRTAF